MKRFLKWLDTKFSRHSAATESDECHTAIEVRPEENPKEELRVKPAFDAEVPGRVESDEPGKKVLIPGKYADDDTITQGDLRILDEWSPEDSESDQSGESTGVNPYNSGSFDKSKSWKSRSPK